MRYVYIAVIVVLTALVLSFKIQNLESVTLTFWTASVTLPVSILIVAVYVLGMFTGGFLFNLLRTAVRGATGAQAE